jgi:flagellin
VAAETSEMTRFNILQQAAVSVLGQANSYQQLALKLLG